MGNNQRKKERMRDVGDNDNEIMTMKQRSYK